MMRGFLSLLIMLIALPAVAVDAPVRPFVSGSLAQIQAAWQGKPFILAFWSVTCTHCPAELKTLAGLKRQYPKLDIVLVAADTPAVSAETAQLARSYGLGQVEQWVFSDPVPERLRFEIDRRWYGELPRTHFYDRSHKVDGVSGVVPADRLQRWVRESL